MCDEAKQSDSALLALARNGDRAAFGQLVSRYKDLVCAVAYSRLGDVEGALDVAQETFLVTLEKLPFLSPGSKLAWWLRKVTRRLCSQWRRSQVYRRRLQEQLRWQGQTKQAETPEAILQSRENGAILRQAVEGLPPALREALVLHYFRGQSLAETASQLGISQAAAHKRLARARRGVREYLTSEIETKLRKARPGPDFEKRMLAAIPVGSVCGKLGLNVLKAGVAEALAETVQSAAQNAGFILTGGGLAVTAKQGIVTGAALILLAAGITGYVATRHSQEATSRPAAGSPGTQATEGTQPVAPAAAITDVAPAGIGLPISPGSQTWEDYLQELDSWEPGWRQHLTEGFLTDPDNAFSHYLLAAALMEPRPVEARTTPPGHVIANLVAYLDENEKALAEVRAGLQAEYYKAPPWDSWRADCPYRRRFKDLAALLCEEATLLAVKGDIPGAVEDCLGTFKLASQMANQRDCDNGFAAVDIYEEASRHLYSVLSDVRDPLVCQKVVAQLEELGARRITCSAFMSEALEELVDVLYMVRADPTSLQGTEAGEGSLMFGDAEWLSALAVMPESEFQREIARMRSTLAPFIAALDRPYPELQSLPEPELDDASPLSGLVRDGVRSLPTTVGRVSQTKTQIAATEAMAAVKWYQLQTGTFPGSLDALVPGYLPAAPIDPFSGEPLRYRKTDTGAAIYSVGYDGKDDGGVLTGEDIVFEIR